MNVHDTAVGQSTAIAVTRPNIGRILINTGKISRPEDVHRIRRMQNDEGLRFGEAAVQLGLVTEDDVRHTLSQQFDYPCLPVDSDAVDHSVIAALRPHHPHVEALRALRSQIALRWYTDYKYLVVTAPSARQGTSHIAANLAVVFSQMHARTLLIDGDMRNARQHELFRLRSRPGLSDILAGRAGAKCIQRVPLLGNLFVLSAGTEPPNPLELLIRPALNELINGIAEQFDVVIVDTPPALEYGDAQILSVRTGGALIVARRHHARIGDIEKVKQQLTIAGAQAIGAVLTDF